MPLRRVDPTSRLRGWRHLAAEVDRLRGELESDGIQPVLATERWTQTSELRFLLRRPSGGPYRLGTKMGDRDSQYDLWRPNPTADPSTFAGKTFLLVGVELDALRPAFEIFEAIPAIEYREQGQLVNTWKVVIARNFRGWDSMK